MAEKGNGFFQDQDGNFSSGRLIAFMVVCTGILCVIMAIIVGVIALYTERQTALPQALLVAGPMLTSVGLGFQGWHKMSETGQVQARFTSASMGMPASLGSSSLPLSGGNQNLGGGK